jgi:hypothetical protein
MFGFVIGFIEHIQIISTSNSNSSRIYTSYNSLWHALSLLSLLSLHQSFGKGFQRRPFHFLCVPKLYPCFSYRNDRLTDSQQLNFHSRLNLPMTLTNVVTSKPEIKWTLGKLKVNYELKTSPVKVKVMLRQEVSRPVYLDVRHPSGALDQIFITAKQFWGCGVLGLLWR